MLLIRGLLFLALFYFHLVIDDICDYQTNIDHNERRYFPVVSYFNITDSLPLVPSLEKTAEMDEGVWFRKI